MKVSIKGAHTLLMIFSLVGCTLTTPDVTSDTVSSSTKVISPTSISGEQLRTSITPSATSTATDMPSTMPGVRPSIPVTSIVPLSEINSQDITLLAEFNLENAEDIDISADSSILAVSTKNALAVWDLVTGQLLWSAEHEPEQISSGVLFSPDSDLLALKTFYAVDVYDVPTGKHLANHDCRRSSVSSMAFSSNGDLLGVGGAFDGAVDIRDTRTGQSLSLGLEGPPRQIMSVAFSPDGHIFAAASNFGNIRLWSLPDGQHISDMNVPLEDLAGPIAFSPDSSILTVVAGGLAAGALSIEQWEVVNEKQLTSFETFNYRKLTLSLNGRLLVIATIDNQLEFVEVANGQAWPSLPLSVRVKKLVLSPDSRLIGVIGDEGKIGLYGQIEP